MAPLLPPDDLETEPHFSNLNANPYDPLFEKGLEPVLSGNILDDDNII
jgi:hypothetical protein